MAYAYTFSENIFLQERRPSEASSAKTVCGLTVDSIKIKTFHSAKKFYLIKKSNKIYKIQQTQTQGRYWQKQKGGKCTGLHTLKK